MKEIIIYTTATCPYCVNAKKLLEKKGAIYREIPVDLDPALRDEMIARTERRTVPQIFIGDVHVGGCDDLYALEREGKLEKLLD